jgi:hypothetical protein
MKNYKKYQLKLFCTILILALFSTIGLGQNKKVNFVGNRTEKKAEKSNYIVHDQGDYIVLYNKKNSLMIYESDFERRIGFTYVDEIIKFNDRSKIDSLVIEFIAPYYRKLKSKYTDDILSFQITFYAKTDGKICELSFSFIKDTNIPFKSIEKLEDAILALGLKLVFYNPNSYIVKDVLWVYYPYSISVARMKEKLKEKSE